MSANSRTASFRVSRSAQPNPRDLARGPLRRAGPSVFNAPCSPCGDHDGEEKAALNSHHWFPLHQLPDATEGAAPGLECALRRIGISVGAGWPVKKSLTSLTHSSGFSCRRRCDVLGMMASSAFGSPL
jgi:hypothetical protein